MLPAMHYWHMICTHYTTQISRMTDMTSPLSACSRVSECHCTEVVRASSIQSSPRGGPMALNLLQDKGVPLAKQRFTWKELVQPPYSKLDDDAFTRVRVILMNGIESEALRFSHACARMNKELQRALAH